MNFEWDNIKSERNYKKHHVTFEEATSVFDYPLSVTFEDHDHSLLESRELTIGYSVKNRLLIVSTSIRNDKIRIISARLATKREIKDYERGIR